VLIQEVPVYGIIDTAADITIMGGQLFRKVASVAHLKKKHLKRADKTPCNYDQHPFSDYRQELVHTLSSARLDAATNLRNAQQRYKKQHDKNVHDLELKIGDWVLVYFPKEDSGKNCKLSRPWHGPYRVIGKMDPDVTVCKVYFPEQGTIQVHQQRIQICPFQFPAGYYWYGAKSVGPGRPPKWVDRMLESREPSHKMIGLTDPSMELSDYTDCLDNNVSNADTPLVTAQDTKSHKMSVKDECNNRFIRMTRMEFSSIYHTDQTTLQGLQWKTRTRTIVPPQRYKT